MSHNLKSLINKRNKGFVALLNSGQPSFTKYQNQCFKCVLKPLKPHRSYHCRTCERDIIYMDHHCVWANNCIGLNNYRYFLGFLVYLSMALPALVFTFQMRDMPARDQIEFYLFIGLYFTDVSLSLYVVPWTIWNWYMALSGSTNVEHQKQVFKQKFDEELDERFKFIQIYRITSMRENLFIIFGTQSFFSAILLPAERTLPLRGLEWSFMNFASKIELPSTNKKTDD